MHSSKLSHMCVANRVVRYLKHAPGLEFLLPLECDSSLSAFCDVDWASCPNTRRSVTSYLIKFGSSPISWKSKKQSIISRSSVEAEYRSLASTVIELVWLIGLFNELNVPISLHVPLYYGKSVIQIASNSVFHELTKHIDIDCHFIREKVLAGLLSFLHLCTSE